MTDRTIVAEAGRDLDGDPVEVLRAVWADALGVDEVDPDEGFFDLGATSEMILGVVRELRRRWPDLRIVDVFSHPTVGQLAAFLSR
ncbi:acyl carrier protein [Micromonospora cathayae]|uniref:Acyl carrier protein n=1 Tax=Micromonospora cathayae TaxID=3028804 RepID=A0ABY7ZUR4_9ACTN|nr:acyl carrier protein [Micromonospora sp. HUAS 3]WDZ86238.1 acyl carrier protein [Micromonospora sp. HUAS 3]